MSWQEILAAYPFLKPIIDALQPVVGDAYHLLLSGIRTHQKARELLTLTGAMSEAQASAPHAEFSYENNQWAIKMPERPPTNLILPASSELRLRLDERRYKALAGSVAEAAMELFNETSFPEKLPKEDWVVRYIESVSHVTDENMQNLWGRILAGEIKSPGSFSLRALSVVSNLAEYEAKLFDSLAKHVVRWKFFGFIPTLDDHPFLRSKGLGAGTIRVLAAAQLAAETPAGINLLQTEEQHGAFDYGKNRMVFVRQKYPPVAVVHNCWTLAAAGLELLALVERSAEPENMQLLVDIFKRFGLEPEVGSYVLRPDGREFEFTSDREQR